ncbi:MAG: DUF4290 domain-containing protein [Bacteroidales bacterium]
MEYNTQLKRLVLPEYGRNIQNMVDHALSIEDRAERTRCAHTIIDIMGNMFPHLRNVEDFRHKLWDHLAIMADFKLDIDYPYEIVKKENLYNRPDNVAYKTKRVTYKHYGRYVEDLIEKCSAMEPGKERNNLTSMIGNQMKKSFLTWNKETVDDKKIIDDMRELSRGDISMNPDVFRLSESKDLLQKKPKQNIQRKNPR